MRLPRFSRWKAVYLASVTVLAITAGALAFPPGNAGDTVADNVLGQPDFVHRTANIPHATTLNTAGFNNLGHVAIDKSGHVYVSDANNNRVLGYANLATLTSGQAATLVIGQPDFFSTSVNRGVSPNAGTLDGPAGVAVDSSNNLYVSDLGNNRVLIYFTPFTQTASISGSGDTIADLVIGQGDFSSSGCNAPSAETLCNPNGLALDTLNNLWVADQKNNRVTEYYSPLFNSSANFVLGQLNLFSNSPNQGNSLITASELSGPSALAVDSHNNIYVADKGNNRVLEYNNPLGSGSGAANHQWGQGGFTTGFCNLNGISSTSLCSPTGVALDTTNNLYVVDAGNNRILEYNETSNPPTNMTANRVFGQGGSFTLKTCNFSGLLGAPNATSLCNPQDVATSGTMLVATDISNNRALVYKTPLTSQTANVVLGQPDFLHNAANTVDKVGMDNPSGIAIDQSNRLYVADYANNRVLGYTSAASFANNAPAALVIGQPDFFSAQRNQGIAVGAGTLANPEAVATDSSGNLYVSDLGNNRVLEYNAPFSQGKVQGFTANRVYGQAGSFTTPTCNLGGLAANGANTLCNPRGLALDTHSNLYVADQGNCRVLEYPSGSTMAVKVFGQGTTGTSLTTNNCSNSAGVSASTLYWPYGVATDASNNVYIADFQNNRVLKFNETTNPPSNFSANIVFGQSGSFATSSANLGANGLYKPHKLVVDSHSNLYVSDSGNDRILEYKTPTTVDTTADTVFGQVGNFSARVCNFNNAGPNGNSLCGPVGVALDSAQDLLVGDFTNNRVLKYLQPLATAGTVTPSPSPIVFGAVAQHSTLTKTLTVTNSGIVPVLFTGASITGTNAADFKVTSNTCQGYVKNGTACAVGLSFTPAAAVGSGETATLTLFDNGTNSPQAITLTGTSVTQTTVTPTSVSFGTVTHSTTSAAQTVTLKNNQSVSISLSPAPAISAGSPTFKISNTTCGASVVAFSSCTASVTCTPAGAGSLPGTLKITDSPDTVSPHNVSLSCTGASGVENQSKLTKTAWKAGSAIQQ
jgi:sugar lactone lactonase YvrE